MDIQSPNHGDNCYVPCLIYTITLKSNSLNFVVVWFHCNNQPNHTKFITHIDISWVFHDACKPSQNHSTTYSNNDIANLGNPKLRTWKTPNSHKFQNNNTCIQLHNQIEDVIYIDWLIDLMSTYGLSYSKDSCFQRVTLYTMSVSN